MNDPTLTPLASWRFEQPESPSYPREVVEARFTDSLDAPYRLEVIVHSTEHGLSARDFVGHAGVIEMGEERLQGIVAQCSQEHVEERGVSRYRFVVVPTLWLLSQRRTSRIFQHKSPIDIVDAIVADYGGAIDTPARRLEREYAQREYVAQYDETDLDFVLRLLADHGVTLATGLGPPVLSDALAGFAEEAPAVPYRPGSALDHNSHHVLSARFEDSFSPALATVRDYDASRPPVRLEGRHFDADAFAREGVAGVFDFAVGKFADENAGLRRAGDVLEATRSEHRRAVFRTSFPLPTGRVFRLVEHPRADANIDWLVVRTSSHVTGVHTLHELTAIPARTRRRPARRRHPRIIGTQTAFVVGEPGEEIDVDAEGRVCLHLHWDRRTQTHDTTRRVRVSQGWAGPGYGFVCLPRVGDEVVVQFLDGDPDRPLVVGRVHNGVSPPPQRLPEDKALSTWRSRSTPGGDGFNELTFDDAAGAERIFVHAQHDLIAQVENDVHIDVKGHVFGAVIGNSTGSVSGDGSVSIDGDASVSVSGDISVDASNIKAHAKSDIVLDAGATRVDQSAFHKISTGWMRISGDSAVRVITPHFHVWSPDIVLDAHGSKISISSGGINIESAGDIVVNGAVIKLN